MTGGGGEGRRDDPRSLEATDDVAPATRRRPAYQDPPSAELREVVWASGAFTPLQLFRVAAWKSAQGLAWLTLSDEDSIRGRTAGALIAIDKWRDVDLLKVPVSWDDWRASAANAIGVYRTSGLLALSGVGYPLATALLAFLAPRAFPVFDRWTALAVYGTTWRPTLARNVVYERYAQRLVEVAGHFSECESVHAVDQAVMNAAIARYGIPDAHPMPFEPIGVPG